MLKSLFCALGLFTLSLTIGCSDGGNTVVEPPPGTREMTPEEVEAYNASSVSDMVVPTVTD